MSTTTDPYPDFSGLTFEKVWAALMETRRTMDRMEKERQESLARLEETVQKTSQTIERLEQERKEALVRKEKERQESLAREEKEWQERKETLARQDKEREELLARMEKEQQKRNASLDQLEKTQKRTSRELGKLGHRFGEVIEHLVRPAMIPRFNELGFSFKSLTKNLTIFDPVTKKTLTELDAILENGDAVIVIEIKSQPTLRDVQQHIQRLHFYREFRAQEMRGDSKAIFGAVAGAVFSDEVQEAALQEGFYVIVPSGKTVRIAIPDGFVPRKF